MSTFRHDAIAFNYIDVGEGVPFIFLHGLGNDLSQPLNILTHHEGVRLLSFDFRSHGASLPVGDLSKLSIQQFAQDVEAFQSHLGLKSAVIGGTSLGGAVAINFALHNPTSVLGLILSRPAWLNVVKPANLRILEVVANHIRKHGAREGAQVFLASNEYKKLEQASTAAARSVLRLFDEPLADERIDRFELLPQSIPFESLNDLQRIAVPTLVIGNDQDPIHPLHMSNVLAMSIPQCELQIITSQAVDANAHRAEANRAILAFLKRPQVRLRRLGQTFAH